MYKLGTYLYLYTCTCIQDSSMEFNVADGTCTSTSTVQVHHVYYVLHVSIHVADAVHISRNFFCINNTFLEFHRVHTRTPGLEDRTQKKVGKTNKFRLRLCLLLPLFQTKHTTNNRVHLCLGVEASFPSFFNLLVCVPYQSQQAASNERHFLQNILSPF